jgi:hypothetical protein
MLVRRLNAQGGVSMPDKLFSGNKEPSINELLTDEIAQQLRAADGLSLADVLRDIEAAKRQTAQSFSF